MKIALIIWLVGALLHFLLTSSHTIYKEKSEERPLFTGCFTLVYALAWPILVPYLVYLTIRDIRKE